MNLRVRSVTGCSRSAMFLTPAKVSDGINREAERQISLTGCFVVAKDESTSCNNATLPHSTTDVWES